MLYESEIKNETQEKPLESNDKTFNKLCKLQKLIKKESSMKKLCNYYLLYNIFTCSYKNKK